MSGFVCYNCGWWTDVNGVSICGYSGRPTVRHDSCEAWKTTVKTNADRIRAMTDEELAKYLAWLEDERAGADVEEYDDDQRISACLDWLREEAGE